MPKLIAYLIDHCVELFGESVLTLLGPCLPAVEVPVASDLLTSHSAVSRNGDSGADEESDSLNSLQEGSNSRNGSSNCDPLRHDDSSIDSLERDSDESSGGSHHLLGHNQVVLQRLRSASHGQSGFANKMSLSNLSRDSGLTLSDTQLYSHEEDDSKSTSPDSSGRREEEDTAGPMLHAGRTSGANQLPSCKSAPHLDLENSINVTYSYGRSVGVSIDGSCHDVVRKRKHEAKFKSNNSGHHHHHHYQNHYHNQHQQSNNSNIHNTGSSNNNHQAPTESPTRMRAQCTTPVLNRAHRNQAKHSNQNHRPLDISRSCHALEAGDAVIEPIPDRHPLISNGNYRYRRPPLSALLANRGLIDDHLAATSGALRRTASEESLVKESYSSRSAEPLSLPYHLINVTTSQGEPKSNNGTKNSGPAAPISSRNIVTTTASVHRSARVCDEVDGAPHSSQGNLVSVCSSSATTIVTSNNKITSSSSSLPCSSSNNTSANSSSPANQSNTSKTRIGSIASATSETLSHRSNASKHSVKSSSLSSCSIRSNPLAVSPPSYQETMSRKELMARMASTSNASRKISSTSSSLHGHTEAIYQQSLRVYNADIHSGANLTLRAVPVRVNHLENNKNQNGITPAKSGQNGSTTIPVRVSSVPSIELAAEQRKNSMKATLSARPSVEQRCAKDMSDDWRKDIHWSVAHLRTLFAGQNRPLQVHRPVAASKSVLVKSSGQDFTIDGRYNKKSLMARSSLDLSPSSSQVFSSSSLHLNNNNRCASNQNSTKPHQQQGSVPDQIASSPSKATSNGNCKSSLKAKKTGDGCVTVIRVNTSASSNGNATINATSSTAQASSKQSNQGHHGSSHGVGAQVISTSASNLNGQGHSRSESISSSGEESYV